MTTTEEIMELADRYALHHTVNYKTSSLTRNSLQSAIEALVRDAERYRWLREQDNEDFCFAVIVSPHFHCYEAKELDQAIDASKEALK